MAICLLNKTTAIMRDAQIDGDDTYYFYIIIVLEKELSYKLQSPYNFPFSYQRLPNYYKAVIVGTPVPRSLDTI